MNLVDTHAHLDFISDDKNIEDWIEEAKNNSVSKIISVGTSVDVSVKCVDISDKYSDETLQIFASVGIHAEDGKGDIDKYGSLEKCAEELAKIVHSSKKVVGIGECGYDFRIDEVSEEEKKFQRELFEVQIKLAEDSNLPLIVHCRNAWDQTFKILDGKTLKQQGVFHSWTGGWEDAKKAINLGFYISFSGIVTFKNAPKVQEVAKKVPLEMIVVETDSPFLTPEPFRGLGNEPKNVRITAEFLAKLRNISLDEIAKITSENAERLFGFNKID